ncbi:Mlp family lipoprotein [Borrelia persica]|uniref:Mlp family lipoprotein n=1 Tax=Borrelia persica TaxID=44448 RepID=UPI000466DC6C|nr:Mlp family lipoprotein [Borrelia persica]
MHKYLKHILIYSLILIYSCTDEIHKVKGLAPIKHTPPTSAPQTDENKKFNTIMHGFKKRSEGDSYHSYDKFISWIENKPDKKKELDTDFTEAYNWLEKGRKDNAPEKTLDEYISDAIIYCESENIFLCIDGNQDNRSKIFLFFARNHKDIFEDYHDQDPEAIFMLLKRIVIHK